MEPDKRQRIYREAQGEPLLRAATQVILQARDTGVTAHLAAVGRSFDRALRMGGEDGKLNPRLAASPLRFVGNMSFEQVLGALDEVANRVETEEGQASLNMALNIVRVAARVEKESLTRIAIDIPEGEHPKPGHHLIVVTGED